MPWKDLSIGEFAKELGIDIAEVREKQRLMEMILKVRKAKGLSQAALAKKIGVTQSRIAQIESGLSTQKVTFDVLFRILTKLGYDYTIAAKLAA